MKLYFAPLEGITGFVFRNAYEKYYGGIDRYFTPFITPHTKKNMDTREKRDILPENNKGINLIPQVLTNKSEELISISKELQEYGYQEINLNIGCPSKTVTSKGKGAAFLENPTELERFFDEYFSTSDIGLSIKTRIGMWETSEAERIFSVFEKFPFTEVIIHARLGSEFYGGTCHYDVFEQYGSYSKHSLCYNGDIKSQAQLEELDGKWAFCDKYMLGRGLIANPDFTLMDHTQTETFRQFHNELLEGYMAYLSGDRPTLFHMKELWGYWGRQFPNEEKLLKQIKKSNSVREYMMAVNSLLIKY
jgi:tRNA-dihydrouridine synthase